MSELHTCPNCHRANFTARGLKSHRCRPATLDQSPLTQAVAPAAPMTIDAALAAPDSSSAALHNRLHHLAESSRNTREQMESTEIAALLLCAVELEHQRTLNAEQDSGSWKAWVKNNCSFSYDTSNRYARTLRCAREGIIDGLHPDSLPTVAPSLMDREQLQGVCARLAASLPAIGGIRQLYRKLEIVALPSKGPDGQLTIHANRNTKGGPTKSSTPTRSLDEQLSIDEGDAIYTFRKAVEALDQAINIKQHRDLPKLVVAEVIDALLSHVDALKQL